MLTKVLSCKAKPPIEGADVIAAEIGRAHAYYNRLVELHRAFRAATEEARRRLIPGLEEAETATTAAQDALATLREQVRLRNAVARRKVATDADRNAITIARQALASTRAERKRLRATAQDHAGYQTELAALVIQYQGILTDPESNRRRCGLLKEARAACGVYPGTYLRIESAIDQALKTARGELRFRRWTGDGLVGPQLTNPNLTVGRLLQGQDTRLRVQFLPCPNKSLSGHGGAQRVLFWVRVQSAGRDPVWAKIPAYMSRGQLPDDAVITWASVIRRQVSVRRHRHLDMPDGVWLPYYEWSVQLTIRTHAEKPRAESGACGVNLGWRVLFDGSLRVGYVAGSDGRRESLALPPKLVDRWHKVRSIQGIRDKNFDAARAALVQWLSEHTLPEWLAEATESLTAWKSRRRLGGLQGVWARSRFEGDEDAFATLTAWRVQDVHLEQYERMLAAKAFRARRKWFCAVVAGLRRRYRTILVDGTEQKKMMRLPCPEDNKSLNETARSNARIAAPGMLRSMLVQAGARPSAAQDITRTCHQCGTIEDWDHAADLVHACSHCEHTWDQDRNAATNLLARAKVLDETPGAARVAEGANGNGDGETEAKKGGRWARRKADRSRRLAEKAAENQVGTTRGADPFHEG